MIIIDKDDLEKYRLAVAKVAFLKCYDQYRIIQDIPKTSCFIAQENGKDTSIIISVLWKPIIDLQKYNLPIIVYYQKKIKSMNHQYKIEKLSKKYDEIFSKDLNMALYSAMMYYQENSEYHNILEEVYYDACIAKDTSGFLCKYYSEEIFSNDKYNRIDGNISFLNPKHFNDPFDCNCMNLYNCSISDMFRVLCTTEDYQNILMWSYYCTNHQGYCLKYKKHDIINEILSFKINGLCIIGKVDYKPNRPSYIAKGISSFSDLKFWIDCTFTKFKHWEHENEYRFVLLSDNFNDGGDALSVGVPVVEYYSGCECNSTKKILTDSLGKKHPTIQLQKDLNGYKLN